MRQRGIVIVLVTLFALGSIGGGAVRGGFQLRAQCRKAGHR